ncbi:MAG: response regulator, partial [bacterium]|nr:response regulator [bacterium]
TVMVVDDEPQVLALLTSALRAAGFEVIQAATGSLALDTFESSRDHVRIIVLDLDLPDIRGTECLARIRKMGSSVPAILVTGDIDPDIEAQLDANTRLLRKPFRVAELERMVSVMIDARRHHSTPA